MRQIKRLAFRNERKFYKFINKEGKPEITTVAPEMNREVISFKNIFDHDYTQYGAEYSGDFLSDIQKLFTQVPIPSKLIANMENAEYCNQETDDKNCYLNAGGHFNEDSMYNTYALRTKRTVDNYRVRDSEQIYRSMNIYKSQKIFFSQFIENSFNILFSYDLVGCQNALFCHGLRNSNYSYKNKVLPKEERETIATQYKNKMKSYTWLQEILREYEEFILQFPKKAIQNTNTENVTGNAISNSKDIYFSTSGEESESVMYANIYTELKDCAEIESIGRAQRSYNIASAMQLNHSIVCSHIFSETHTAFYAYSLQWGSNLLWCIGLNNKSNFILNKNYDEQSRNQLATKIFQELQSKNKLGDFFDLELSPFPYNDTVAYEYYPVQKIINQWQEKILNPNGIWTVIVADPEKFISDAILDFGGEEKIKIKRRTKELEINISANMNSIQANEIPDNIENITDEILQKAIICSISGRPFRIVKPELDFHRKHKIPLPRTHPDIRHQQKIQNRPGRELFLRTCNKCWIKTMSIYPENTNFKVYCETCYDKEIY